MGELRPVLRLNLSGCGIGPDKALEADRYNAALDMAAYADTHGFAIVNVEEHHDVSIGRLEKARAACFGAGAAAERDIYGAQMTMASIGGRRAAVTNPADEDAAKREMRTEGEYDRLLSALHRCGPAVAAATLGIATRPYAGAWIVVPLATRDRPWTARHDTRLALIKEGLAAIERLGSREL